MADPKARWAARSSEVKPIGTAKQSRVRANSARPLCPPRSDIGRRRPAGPQPGPRLARVALPDELGVVAPGPATRYADDGDAWPRSGRLLPLGTATDRRLSHEWVPGSSASSSRSTISRTLSSRRTENMWRIVGQSPCRTNRPPEACISLLAATSLATKALSTISKRDRLTTTKLTSLSTRDSTS